MSARSGSVGSRRFGSLVAQAALVAAIAPAGAGQVTQRVSVTAGGGQANSASTLSSISGDGRVVAFESNATNLVTGDTNALQDIFARDRVAGTTVRVSVSSGGVQADGGSYEPSVSADGRYVSFRTPATNLVAGDTNGTWDVFVRDLQLNVTERVSVSTGGAEANGASERSSISGDGRYVAFWSLASSLVPGDTNGTWDIFLRDRTNGTTDRVSVTNAGGQANSASYEPSISADGRFLAFRSTATNLVAGDTNGASDIFVRDLVSGTTERVSVSSGSAQADAACYAPSISADGRFVAFESDATNLAGGDTNSLRDIFVRDRQLGVTERVSLSSGGVQEDAASYLPSISADGRNVAFWSLATNLVGGDSNGTWDVFMRDRQLGITDRVSVDSAGVQGIFGSDDPAISGDGRYVAFRSSANNLVQEDTNGFADIFIRDRFGGTSFTSLCDPGVGGVIACPCANSPSGAGRGCNNSANTGGAALSASGGTFLSSDSLVFTTSGEKPTATSIVLQGTTFPASGVVYGQGVRCVGGILKRLFTESASGGSITAPNFASGDPTVSKRSAAQGDAISAGQSRWYLVYYRDPVVLGGCPSSSTFNATQTGQVTWSP